MIFTKYLYLIMCTCRKSYTIRKNLFKKIKKQLFQYIKCLVSKIQYFGMCLYSKRTNATICLNIKVFQDYKRNIKRLISKTIIFTCSLTP